MEVAEALADADQLHDLVAEPGERGSQERGNDSGGAVCQILVTERTMMKVDDFSVGTIVDEISLKGISRPIRIYELGSLTAS